MEETALNILQKKGGLMRHIRRATLHDVDEIIECHRAAVHAIGAEFYSQIILDEWSPPNGRERREGTAFRLNDPEELTVVSIDGERIIGFGGVNSSQRVITSICVHPEYGGKGVGKSLLKYLEAIAAKAACSSLSLDSSLNAISFYEANGYKQALLSGHKLSSGYEMACVVMNKAL